MSMPEEVPLVPGFTLTPSVAWWVLLLMADFLETKPKPQRAFLVGVQTNDMPAGEGEELLAELTELVENLGIHGRAVRPG